MAEMITPSGQVQIADEVIAQIASVAVQEVEGVTGMAGQRISRKKPAKGVTLRVENGKVCITVEIAVKSGTKIQEVATEVQKKVKSAIETMTNFTVQEVCVNVTGLVA